MDEKTTAARELNAKQALALAESGWWTDKTPEEIVRFQLFTDMLCMPFSVFQDATEKVLGRPVWTHEFARVELLRKEFLGERPQPTFDEVVSIIPRDKLILIGF